MGVKYYQRGSWDPHILVDQIVLTDAQLKSFRSSPVQIVPAPGLGRFIEFVGALAFLDASAGAYGNEANTDPRIRYGTSGSEFVTVINQGFFNQGTTKMLHLMVPFSTGGLVTSHSRTRASVENQPLVLYDHLGLADLTGGHADNLLKMTIQYKVWPLDW